MIKNKKLTFLTGNPEKAKTTKEVLTGKYGIEIDVLNPDFEIPEIQADNCADVAKFSAKYACDRLGFPVLKSDCGYFCECLGGLPGPYLRYFSSQIGTERMLHMLRDEQNRKARIEYCFAYCEPNSEPIVFCGGSEGIVSYEPSKRIVAGFCQRSFIPNGQNMILADMEIVNPELERTFWGDARDQFAKWYLNKK